MLTKEHKEKMRIGRQKALEKKRLKKLKELEKLKLKDEKKQKRLDKIVQSEPEPEKEEVVEPKQKTVLEPQLADELFKNEKKEPAKKVSCCDNPNNWYYLDYNLPDERRAMESGFSEVCRVCLSLK